MKKSGLAIIISGPSGSGKTTIVKQLLKRNKRKTAFSVSATTRPRRKGERNGRDYFFITEAKFKADIKRKRFLEWARVFGAYYGTPKASVSKPLRKGRNVVLEIDVQGAKQLRRSLKEAVFIFVLPPSIKVLRERLKRRGTDSSGEIKKRLLEAKREISKSSLFDYRVINRQVGKSVKQIENIIQAEK